MKKLLFVLAFTFIGQQAFSQMYIVTVFAINNLHPLYNSCINSNYDVVMTTIDPTGNLTYQCLPSGGSIQVNGNNIALLNQEFNSIIMVSENCIFSWLKTKNGNSNNIIIVFHILF